MTKLSEKIKNDFIVAGLSPSTQKVYFYSICCCKKYFRKPLNTIGSEELKEYFISLIRSKKSETTIKHNYYALRFLFTETFGKEFPLSRSPVGKASKKLPVVLALQEIKAILDACNTTKQRAVLSVTYSGGLRVSETAKLQISALALT
jgi:integrase/recombinase XerD